MPIYTSNQAKISFSIPGVKLDSKSWDKFQGGEHLSETQNHAPGGMEPSIATGGVSKRTQITIERAWDDTLISAYLAIDNAVNQPCSIGVTPLRARNKTAGRQRTYTGIVRQVHAPDNDSTSSSVEMLQVVIEANEPITG